jgi:hypothetical protein
MLGVTSNPQAVAASLGALIEQGMAIGGPRAAMELSMRWAAGDAAFEAIDPPERDRYLANAEVAFGPEMPPFNAYQPRPRPWPARPGPSWPSVPGSVADHLRPPTGPGLSDAPDGPGTGPAEIAAPTTLHQQGNHEPGEAETHSKHEPAEGGNLL